MKKYAPEKIRNVATVGHGGCGKTSLVEALLYNSKAISRLGRIENGNTVTDFEPEEIKRKISLSTAIAPCEWKDKKINLIDTPGYADFIGEVIGALRATDSIVIVINAVAGVEVQTEKIWQQAKELNLPALIFVNQMDKENADFYKSLEAVKERIHKDATPLQFPIGKEATFKGAIDLISMKARVGAGEQVKEEEIPADLKEEADKYREKLVELAVEVNDKLLEKYLEGE